MKKLKAKFTKEVKQEILARDKVCIISGNPITTYHHCYYGAIQANYGPNRNNADQGVGLSDEVHYEIHHGVNGKGQELRRQCINYLKNLGK